MKFIFYNKVYILHYFFMQIFNIVSVFNATLLNIYAESDECKNWVNLLFPQSNNFFIAKIIWQAPLQYIYILWYTKLQAQICPRNRVWE